MVKLNILLVSFEFPPITAIGGIGSYMYHLSKLLHKLGHSVTVFSANPHGSEVEVQKREFCSAYLIPASNNEEFRSAALAFFHNYILYNNVDIIESPEVGACALNIKRAYPDIPLIVKLHTPGVLITKVSNYYLPLLNKFRFVAGALVRGRIDLGYWAKHDKNKLSDPEYQICEVADKILSPSRALINWAIKFWDLPASKIELILNPFSVDSDLLCLPVLKRSKTISFVGKLNVLKGLNSLTEAIPIVLKKHPEFSFNIVGRDEYVNGISMKSIIEKRLGLFANKVNFTGALPFNKIKEIYATSPICVVPSLWENYPNVVLEAMAAGCAVVASNRGGIPEIVNDHVNGLLINPRSSNDIATKINLLIDNPELTLQIATNGRNDLLKLMQPSTLSYKIERAYYNVLNT